MPRRIEFRYVKFNKPFEVMCQFSPSQNRRTLKDYISLSGIYPAGRLDFRSEGLLILTDDPTIAHRLTDPRFEHPKTYLVQIEGVISETIKKLLESKDILPGVLTRDAIVDIVDEPGIPARNPPVRKYHPTSWLKITLREGKKHQIRRMTAAVGFPTLRLIRISIGSVDYGNLQPGEWRYLSKIEQSRLMSELRINEFNR